jgi:Ca2+/Na+ antiporter
MFLNFLVLAACAVVTVVTVRKLVIFGIEVLCLELGLSSKTKGQIIGYATSLPEFVVVISAACMGVFDAGLWNIVSSNIINWVLFLSASFAYRQWKDMKDRVFLDEIIFGLLSVAIPLVLIILRVDMNVIVAGSFVAFFVIYKLVDRVANAGQETPAGGEEAGPDKADVSVGLAKGLISLLIGIIIIVITGRFLGSSAETLVQQLSIPGWMIGWILGFITSIPELASFFEIFRISKTKGKLTLLEDTQEALDALVASNMSNLGIILPGGMFLFALL